MLGFPPLTWLAFKSTSGKVASIEAVHESSGAINAAMYARRQLTITCSSVGMASSSVDTEQQQRAAAQ
jgi:hypothetical protein